VSFEPVPASVVHAFGHLKAACAAAANTMVTVDTNWADPELMLHTYRRMRG